MHTFSYNNRLKVLEISTIRLKNYDCYRKAIVILILIASAVYAHGKTFSEHNPKENVNTILLRDSIPKDSLCVINIDGEIENVFHENVDSVMVVAIANEYSTQTYSDSKGLFAIELPVQSAIPVKSIRLSFLRYDYYTHDTIIFMNDQDYAEKLNIILKPKYKILLKGRLFAGNTLLEDANVSIRYRNESRHLRTMKCYTDEENYWNCLYLGMFKTEIVAENPQDSIYLSFSKPGFRSQSYKLRFADYSGDVLKFRMKYADTIPDLPHSNLNLKLTYPMGKNPGWFLGLSFYSRMNNKMLNRFRPGMEISLSSYKRSTSLNTLPGTPETRFDTIYTKFFIGPSFLFYLTKPDIRRFSTYIGSTFSIALDGGEFVMQPFLGTRYFIDMRRAICMDLRYISYSLSAKNYSFTYVGNATSSNEKINVKRILINIGVQIYF
jgi:hypothetical protein